MSIAPDNYELAVEIAQCPRLIKGYGETHERGLRSFNLILSTIEQLGERRDGATWLRRFRDAALADDHGIALDQAMQDLH